MAEVATAPVSVSNLEDPALYINRDLALIEFQRRVLEEAQDPANRLLERVKFLSILFSNLDEFFMVRVAHLQQQVERKATDVGPDGTSASTALELIRSEIIKLLAEAYHLFNEGLRPGLAHAGIHFEPFAKVRIKQKR
jgi:polyphosphate kinase